MGKKRSTFWIMIGIGVLIFILLIIISSVLSLGERLRRINEYVEYSFYVLAFLLVYFLIINPIRIILFAPTFSVVTTVDEATSKKHHSVYKRVALNIINNNDLDDETKKILREGMQNKEELKNKLIDIFNGTIKKDINKIIFNNAKTVMISTAISQNGRLDMLTVLTVNIKMIKEIVSKCGYRPSYPRLGKLSLNVLTTALIAESLEGLDINDLFPASTTNFLAEIPLIKPIASSVLQGISNALLTLRIGYVTRKYLFEEGNVSKEKIRREAIKESIKTIPSVTAEVLAYFPKRIINLFMKKDKNEVNQES